MVLNPQLAAADSIKAHAPEAVIVVEALLEPGRAVTLALAAAGIVSAVAVVEGAMVERGDLLLQLDDAEEQLLLRRLEAMVAKARFDLEGFEALFGKNMASEENVRQARLDYELALIDREHGARRIAQRQLRAPFDGRVIDVSKDQGEWTHAGEALMKLIETERLLIHFFVEPEVAATLRQGQNVFLASKDVTAERVTAEIAYIAPYIDPVSGWVAIRAELTNPHGKLRPGQSVHVLIPSAP